MSQCTFRDSLLGKVKRDAVLAGVVGFGEVFESNHALLSDENSEEFCFIITEGFRMKSAFHKSMKDPSLISERLKSSRSTAVTCCAARCAVLVAPSSDIN